MVGIFSRDNDESYWLAYSIDNPAGCRTMVAFEVVQRSAGLEDSAEPYEWKTDLIKTV